MDGGGRGVVVASEVVMVAIDPRSVLLGVGTNPPYVKSTADGIDLSGQARRDDVAQGIFVCAMGCPPPLFLTNELTPTSVLIGWLTFYQPILDDHVVLVPHPRL